MTQGTAGQASLFDTDDTAPECPPVPSVDPDELRHAMARIVVTSAVDPADPRLRKRVLLVVECPFCDCRHIHPGGWAGDVRLGERRARCVGRPGGRYLIKVVDA